LTKKYPKKRLVWGPNQEPDQFSKKWKPWFWNIEPPTAQNFEKIQIPYPKVNCVTKIILKIVK